MYVCEAGTTLKFTATFTDADDALTDLDTDTQYFKIYDSTKTQIGETITSGVTRESEGVYYYLYETTFDTDPQTYWGEIGGEVSSVDVLVRRQFQTRFDV